MKSDFGVAGQVEPRYRAALEKSECLRVVKPEQRRMKGTRLFLVSAALLLLTTAMFKLIGARGSAPALDLKDPLLMLTNRQVFNAVATVEIVIAIVLLIGRKTQIQLLALSWLATLFLVYRVAQWVGAVGRPCGCLGNAAEWFPWLAKHEQVLMNCLLAFLLVGSYGLLLLEWWRGRNRADTKPSELNRGEAQV